MALRFWYEMAVGAATFISILIFEERGIITIVALAILPIIMRLGKYKADERETFLFYKGTQTIFMVILFLIVAGFVFTDLKFSDLLQVPKQTWFLLLTGFMVINSLVRLYLLQKK